MFVQSCDGDLFVEVEFAQYVACGLNLELGAVAEDEVGIGAAFGFEACITATDNFGHRVWVIVCHGANAEATVTASVGDAVNRRDHGGDGVCAHEVGDVEAFNAVGRLGQAEIVGKVG